MLESQNESGKSAFEESFEEYCEEREKNIKKILKRLEEEILDGDIKYEILAQFAHPSVLHLNESPVGKIKKLLEYIEKALRDGTLIEEELHEFLSFKVKPYLNPSQPEYRNCYIYAGSICGLEKK